MTYRIKSKPMYIKEPYGLPFELTEKGKYRITTLPNEKIESTDGKWYLVSYDNPNSHKRSYVVTDGFHTDFLVVYENKSVAYDYPERIPKKVRERFERQIRKRIK
jgi:hypothetical protein